LYDESQKTASTYGATRTPHIYILQKEKGNLVVKYIGAIDNNSDDEKLVTDRYAEDAVNALLDGKPVKVSETKAIGCTIKWRNQ